MQQGTPLPPWSTRSTRIWTCRKKLRNMGSYNLFNVKSQSMINKGSTLSDNFVFVWSDQNFFRLSFLISGFNFFVAWSSMAAADPRLLHPTDWLTDWHDDGHMLRRQTLRVCACVYVCVCVCVRALWTERDRQRDWNWNILSYSKRCAALWGQKPTHVC